MKAIFLALTAFTLALPATGRAQGDVPEPGRAQGDIPAPSRAQGDVRWGVKGGLNISGLRGAGGMFDTKRGVVAGGFGVFDLSPEFGFEVDALFMMKGGKLIGFGVDPNGNLIGPISEGFFILDYLEIPILARFNTPALGGLRPHVYAGPTLAVKLSARVRYAGFPGEDLDAARSLDSGLAFGVSADLPLGTRSLVLDARFGRGLTNALGWAGPDLKNDAFSLMAGVAF